MRCRICEIVMLGSTLRAVCRPDRARFRCDGVMAWRGYRRTLPQAGKFQGLPGQCPEMLVVPARGFFMGSERGGESPTSRRSSGSACCAVAGLVVAGSAGAPFGESRCQCRRGASAPTMPRSGRLTELDPEIAAAVPDRAVSGAGGGRASPPVPALTVTQVPRRTYRLLSEAEWEIQRARCAASAGRPADRQLGPTATCCGGSAWDNRADGAGRLVCGQWSRPARHARQCLGVDAGLLCGQLRRRAGQSERREARRLPDTRRARRRLERPPALPASAIRYGDPPTYRGNYVGFAWRGMCRASIKAKAPGPRGEIRQCRASTSSALGQQLPFALERPYVLSRRAAMGAK